MRRITYFVGVLILLSLVLGACGQANVAETGRQVKADVSTYRNIEPAQLKLMLENKDFPLINVHVPYAGEIPGTDSLIPYNEIESNLSKFPIDKGAKVVLYCQSGAMSSLAAKALVKNGYTNVWNLDGGMIAWKKQGYELIRVDR